MFFSGWNGIKRMNMVERRLQKEGTILRDKLSGFSSLKEIHVLTQSTPHHTHEHSKWVRTMRTENSKEFFLSRNSFIRSQLEVEDEPIRKWNSSRLLNSFNGHCTVSWFLRNGHPGHKFAIEWIISRGMYVCSFFILQQQARHTFIFRLIMQAAR